LTQIQFIGFIENSQRIIWERIENQMSIIGNFLRKEGKFNRSDFFVVVPEDEINRSC